MSSENDTDVEEVPRKRRKEKHSSPTDGRGRSDNKRPNGARSLNPPPSTSKKARIQNSQLESLPTSPSTSLNSCSSSSGVTGGKIVRVRLRNFMCHRNLVFTFGDKVNFISGKNGSGKSAILTALVLGLGGRTSDTNRGTSLAKLLKNGENRGAIEITISNQGVRGYDAEKYGDEITVVRNISEKTSAYKLLSDRGQVVSTKRDDLRLIMMSFNIQVNNPVSILNQDTSRTFLKTATPKELYNLFRKGTLIDDIEEKLGELRTRKLPLIKSLLLRKDQAFKDSVKDLLEYSAKIDKYKELVGYQTEITDLQTRLCWVYVADLEGKVSSIEEEMTTVETKIDQLRQSIECREGIEINLNEKLRSLEAAHQEARAECDGVDEANVELEQKVSYHKGIVNRKLSEIKKLQKKIETEMGRCREVQAEIDNSQSRTAEVESKCAKILQQRADLKKRCDDLKAVISTTEVHKQQLSDTVEEATRSVNHTERFASNLVRSMTQKKEYLQGLQTERNELRVYSEWMPQLVAEIDKMHGKRLFENKPLGPFGRYIRVKEECWGPVVESLIGNSLRSFAVSSSRDLATMRKVFENLNIPKEQRPSVTVTQFVNKVYDFSTTEVQHPKYRSLFRTIEVSEPVVANVLLDMFQPDTILLVPSSQETYPLVEDQRNVPHNCKVVMNRDGSKFYPSPNYKCYSARLPEKTRYLQVSREQAIRIAERELKTLQEEYVTHKKALDTGNSKLREEKNKLNELLKELDTLRRQLNTCETKLFEVEQQELPESFDLNVLAEDLQYRQSLLETTKAQLEVLEKEKDEALQECKSLKGSWTEKEKIKDDLNRKIAQVEKELVDVKGQLRKYNTNHNHFKESLKMEMVKKERYTEKLNHLKRELDEAMRTATEVSSERIESERSKQELDREISELNHKVKVLEKIVGKKPLKPKDYENRVEKFKEKTESLKKVTKAVECLTELYEALVKRMDLVLNLVCSSTMHHFSRILARRNFVGELQINHEKKTLVLNVKPDPKVQANTAITTLSGGERSYSMVAFIMSLWQNMTTPFYFLDEFDVFMDEVNRNLIMELLMSHARRNPSKQFVFLTPHATSDESTTDVHFFRMEDPRG